MAKHINVELLSGNVHTLAVRPDMTVGELKESVKVFHPSEDEITRILSTVDLLLDGEKLSDPQMMVSKCIFESAQVQVVFYVQPAFVCPTSFGHKTEELRDAHIPSTENHPSICLQGMLSLVATGYPGVCDRD